MFDKRFLIANKEQLAKLGMRFSQDETKQQKEAKRLFRPVYEAEWKINNKARRIIRSNKMPILIDGKITRSLEIIDGKVQEVRPRSLP